MTEVSLHFSVPFALAAPYLGVKKALLFSFVAVLPDLDVLFRIHRSMSHSLLLLALVYAPVLLLVYKFKPEHFKLACLGLLALISHPLMDCFQTYTPLFYPLLDRSVWVNVEGSVLISPIGLTPQVSATVKEIPTTFKPFETIDAPFFTSGGLLVSVMLIATNFILNLKPQILPRSAPYDVKIEPSNPDTIPTPTARPELTAEDITIILPTLNEEEAIGPVIDELKREGYMNILVVDGYSKDRTVEIAKEKGVRVILQCGNGKAGAIKTAIDAVETPYMLVMDADHTYDPEDVKRMLAYAPEYDEVIGMRVNRENIPWMHRIGNHIISLVFSLVMGKRLTDPCSGMYILKTGHARSLELTSYHFDLEVEVAGQTCAFGKVTEVPIKYRKRKGAGKLRAWRDGFNIMMAVLKVSWLYNPAFILSALAALAALPGIVITLQQLSLRYLYGSEAWSTGWTWLGLILLVIGLQGATIATISLLLKRMERRIILIQKENQTSRGSHHLLQRLASCGITSPSDHSLSKEREKECQDS